MGNTKKVGSTGRFGSRYGVGIRKRLLKVENKQKGRSQCPHCESKSVKRKSRGIFSCSKCHHEFVGGTYFPQTLTGKIVSKVVSQKSFASSTAELMQKEEVAAEGTPKSVEEVSEAKKEVEVKEEKPKKAPKKETAEGTQKSAAEDAQQGKGAQQGKKPKKEAKKAPSKEKKDSKKKEAKDKEEK